MDDGYQTERRDGGIDLGSDSVFYCTPEPLDVEMLLHPFEEQHCLSTFLVKQGNTQSVRRKGIGQERESPALLLVVEDDTT